MIQHRHLDYNEANGACFGTPVAHDTGGRQPRCIHHSGTYHPESVRQLSAMTDFQRQRQRNRRRQNVISRWLIRSAVLLLIVAHVRGDTVKASKQYAGTEAHQGECRASQQSQDGTCSTHTATTTATPECGVWLAPSSLPGAGLGMYAGRDFFTGENLQPSGDIVIPFVDINHHQFERVQAHQFNLLWDEYTWNGVGLYMNNEGLVEVKVASPGFGSAANSFIDLINVEELRPDNTVPSRLHRRTDPGVGAFSTYHNRQSVATTNIQAGEELFVDYGQSWFRDRKWLGPIPLSGDLSRATTLVQRFKNLVERYPSLIGKSNTLNSNSKTGSLMFDDLWNTFVQGSEWTGDSRVLGAYRHTPNEWDQLYHRNQSLKQIRINDGTRTQEWLQEHGTCGDHIREGTSTIRQAGRGGFATRSLPQGSIVAALPLIHVSDRNMFEMYNFPDFYNQTDDYTLAGEQLLTNYCFGHTSSTLLLCPYGPLTSLINHHSDASRINVRIQWSDSRKGNHDPTLLERPMEFFTNDKTAKLAMDLVALRDLVPGEELFLDYGSAWEEAWQLHIQQWNDRRDEVKDSNYVSGYQLTTSPNRLRTVFEQLAHPYPENVVLQCNTHFFGAIDRALWQRTGIVNITDYHGLKWEPCDVLRVRGGDSEEGNAESGSEDSLRYTAVYTIANGNGQDEARHEKLIDAPRQAFRFMDRPYTTDMFLPHAFRHPMMIPDDMFPEYWMNL